MMRKTSWRQQLAQELLTSQTRLALAGVAQEQEEVHRCLLMMKKMPTLR